MINQLCKEIETALNHKIKTPKDFDFFAREHLFTTECARQPNHIDACLGIFERRRHTKSQHALYLGRIFGLSQLGRLLPKCCLAKESAEQSCIKQANEHSFGLRRRRLSSPHLATRQGVRH